MSKAGRDYGIPGEPRSSRCMSTQRLRKATAKDFQEMIRLESYDAEGWTTCVSSGERFHISQVNAIDAGHFIGGRGNHVLFDEKNCHPQSKAENKKQQLTGNSEAYADYILRTYGQDELDRLRGLVYAPAKQLYRCDYLEMRAEYKERIKAAKQRLGI